METLPYELLTLISTFLSAKEKESAREVCKDLYSSINMMVIKVNKMENKIDNILDGRVYILNRLRLAALCGLDKETVSEIWHWINYSQLMKEDGLMILRQINEIVF